MVVARSCKEVCVCVCVCVCVDNVHNPGTLSDDEIIARHLIMT